MARSARHGGRSAAAAAGSVPGVPGEQVLLPASVLLRRADEPVRPVLLPRWTPDEEASTLLASFATALSLRRPSHISSPEMTEYLLTRSEGTIGELAALLTETAIAAIESGEEAINQRTLLTATYAGPCEWRRLFERELV